ncbi:MAG: hypothetical protein ABJB55_02245 [Actinomycetota bacterium]
MRRLIGLIGTIALVSMATIASAATPEVVLDDPGVYEYASSASDGYLVWSANSKAKPDKTHSYVMADGGSPVRIDPPGGQSFSAAIDGTTIVYERDTPEGVNDFWFYDAVTEVRSVAPDGVNTPNHEIRPSLSGDWLLFTRSNDNRVPARDAWRKIVLFNTSTSTSIVLRTMPSRSSYLVSDQVNGDWATFESCLFLGGDYSDCQVFRYQISTGELVLLANPGVQQYAGAVSGDGTVYLVRTANRDHWVCGSHSKLVRYPVGGPAVIIARLPDGRDAFTTFALDETGGSTTMYFDRDGCNGRSGIYRILNADTA